MHLLYLKDKNSMLNNQGKVFPNFYLHLLPPFANTQSPDHYLIIPAFLATSLFLVTFSPFNTFNCLSLTLYPPFHLFVILLIFWYNLLLIQGLERIIHVTFVCHFTMYLVSSTCKYQKKEAALFSLLSSCTISLLLLCQIYITTTHKLTDPTKNFCRAKQQLNRQTWVKGSMTDGNTSLEVVRQKCGTALHRKGPADGLNEICHESGSEIWERKPEDFLH